MNLNLNLAIIVCGVLIGGGVWAVIRYFIRSEMRLSDALKLLTGQGSPATEEPVLPKLADPDSRLERFAVQAYQRAHLPVSGTTMRLLVLRGKSLGEHFAAKIILAVAGFLTPALFAWLGLLLGLGWGAAPLAASLLLGIGGYLLPDFQLRNQAEQARNDAADAMSVFFDLVILERLSNASATQALENAAELCDTPVFARIRSALTRARLQQHPPWTELNRLADELRLPELGDVADILALDDHGAALAGALRARVRELRKSHLAERRRKASADAEGLTVWMVIPVLLFALFFVLPPLLRLTGTV